MAGEALKEVQDDSQSQETAKRERSTILFPYGDLSDAISVAKGINTVGGTSCQIDQIAAQLGHTVTSGTFGQRLNTARIFGLRQTPKGGLLSRRLESELLTFSKKEPRKQNHFSPFLSTKRSTSISKERRCRLRVDWMQPSKVLAYPQNKRETDPTYISALGHAGWFF